MVERSPGLQTTFGVGLMAHSITQTSTSSRFQALSAEGNTLDGLNIHCAIVDELHAHSTRKVYDVLETATGARTQPLLWLITTAGSDRSGICYEQRGYVTKILENVTKDETYFGIIYTLDEDDDWQDPAVWQKANPNYGVSVFPDDIARLAEKAKKMSSAQSNFLTKRLSVWVNADTPLFNMASWDACRDSSLKEDDFRDAECWAAVDLAPRHDFVAYGKLFRRDGEYYYFCRHYLSEVEVQENSNSSYDGWARDGWILTNEGNVTKYDDLELEIEADCKKFQIREICFDPSSAHQFSTRMLDKGFPMIEIRAHVLHFSEATKKADALMSEKKIHHAGDPVLAWEISNVVGHYDRKDNVYPVKERPELKIDGAICLIMALNRAILDEGSGSVYDLKPGQSMEEFVL
jgi:phage terminase large subunit-like protein